ncbi:hypothetical protein CFOL_v3_12702, partial [Cephalotus follicularis]
PHFIHIYIYIYIIKKNTVTSSIFSVLCLHLRRRRRHHQRTYGRIIYICMDGKEESGEAATRISNHDVLTTRHSEQEAYELYQDYGYTLGFNFRKEKNYYYGESSKIYKNYYYGESSKIYKKYYFCLKKVSKTIDCQLRLIIIGLRLEHGVKRRYVS